MTWRHLTTLTLIALLPAIVVDARGAAATTTAPSPGERAIQWKSPTAIPMASGAAEATALGVVLRGLAPSRGPSPIWPAAWEAAAATTD